MDTILAVSHSLNLVRPVTYQEKVFVPLPEGITILPRDREAFLALKEPLPIAPDIWIVPEIWLLTKDAFLARTGGQVLSPEELFRKSQWIRQQLLAHSTFDGGR